jgi:hypothetical protein
MISGRYRLITPDEQLPYRDVEVWQAADTLLGTKVRMILLPRDLPNRAAALDAQLALLEAELHTCDTLAVPATPQACVAPSALVAPPPPHAPRRSPAPHRHL